MEIVTVIGKRPCGTPSMRQEEGIWSDSKGLGLSSLYFVSPREHFVTSACIPEQDAYY